MSSNEDLHARRQQRIEREQHAARSLFTAIALRPTVAQEQQAQSWLSYFAYEIRQADHQEQEADLRRKLEALGIDIKIAHYTGDSSYPTEYTLTYGNVRAMGPTLDLALVSWIEKLLLGDPTAR